MSMAMLVRMFDGFLLSPFVSTPPELKKLAMYVSIEESLSFTECKSSALASEAEIQRKPWFMESYAEVDYNLTL
jgi:hypothetical protein